MPSAAQSKALPSTAGTDARAAQQQQSHMQRLPLQRDKTENHTEAGTQEANGSRQLNLVIIITGERQPGLGIFYSFDLLNLFLRTSENLKLSMGNSEWPRAKPQKSNWRVYSQKKCSQHRATSAPCSLDGHKSPPAFVQYNVSNEGDHPAGQPTPAPAYAACHRSLRRIL